MGWPMRDIWVTLGDLWLTFGALWLPVGLFSAPFGALGPPFGGLLAFWCLFWFLWQDLGTGPAGRLGPSAGFSVHVNLCPQ